MHRPHPLPDTYPGHAGVRHPSIVLTTHGGGLLRFSSGPGGEGGGLGRGSGNRLALCVRQPGSAGREATCWPDKCGPVRGAVWEIPVRVWAVWRQRVRTRTSKPHGPSAIRVPLPRLYCPRGLGHSRAGRQMLPKKGQDCGAPSAWVGGSGRALRSVPPPTSPPPRGLPQRWAVQLGEAVGRWHSHRRRSVSAGDGPGADRVAANIRRLEWPEGDSSAGSGRCRLGRPPRAFGPAGRLVPEQRGRRGRCPGAAATTALRAPKGPHSTSCSTTASGSISTVAMTSLSTRATGRQRCP